MSTTLFLKNNKATYKKKTRMMQSSTEIKTKLNIKFNNKMARTTHTYS